MPEQESTLQKVEDRLMKIKMNLGNQTEMESVVQDLEWYKKARHENSQDEEPELFVVMQEDYQNLSDEELELLIDRLRAD